MAGVGIKVNGLTEFRKELRKLDDKGFTDQLKDANYAIAELVVTGAKGKAGALGKMQARAAETLKPSRQAARAQVTAGGARAPFFFGAEFGSGKYHQFQPWRGGGPGAGYFLYPTIRAETVPILGIYSEAVKKITATAFPD
jgi:hypothetical protein